MVVNFTSMFDLMKAFPDEENCINHLEKLRWNSHVVSPFDPTSKVYICKNNKYKCKNTNKYFDVKTNTLFHSSKVSLQKWFLAIYLETSHKKGISSLQLHRDIGVTQKTAWFMLHRIRNCYGIKNVVQLQHEVEIDETYVGGKNKNRHLKKKVRNAQGRSFKDKVPVLGMVERSGKVIAKTVSSVSSNTITPIILDAINPEAKVYTDEWIGYNDLKKTYKHNIVRHCIGEYVNGKAHTNTIEGFWSLLKRGIVGTYHFVSKKHLQVYVDEFVFRYNTKKMTDEHRFSMFLNNMDNRLTYQKLVYGQTNNKVRGYSQSKRC